MSKKVLVLFLAALLSVCAFTACQKGGKNATGSGSTTSSAGEQSQSGKEQTAQSESNQENTSKEQTKTKESSKTQTTTAKTDSDTKKTDGWKKQADGSVSKGGVSLNVVDYGKSSIGEGEQLIKELIESSVKNAKILSSEKSKTQVVYVLSGVRIGSDAAEYMKLQFVLEKNRGYLVSMMAQEQAALDCDISYVLAHLSELAQ